jgi:hypothetical protein
MIHPPYRSPAPLGERDGGNAGQRKLEPCANESGTSPERTNSMSPIIQRNCTHPVPRTAAGEALLSHNHIALLHGLYDRPNGHVASRAEWVRAARPYADRMSPSWTDWSLRGSMTTMHPAWAKESRENRFIEATITEAGRQIVERNAPARIRGRGAYQGLDSVDISVLTTRRSAVPDEAIKEAVAYANSFGIPLLEPYQRERPNGRVFAISSGLGKPFRIVCREELDQCGPRRWHFDWTREMIDAGCIPARYQTEFQEYEKDDVLSYLAQLRDDERDFRLYTRVYDGTSFLSFEKFNAYLDEEIDFTSTDFDEWNMKECARLQSPTYEKATSSLFSPLAWNHPETNKRVGNVFLRRSEFSFCDIVVTTPAALSCLQQHWDQTGVGLAIETRYGV